MLYHIYGELIFCNPVYAVIDCGGVGYKLFISGNTLGRIAGKINEKVKLYTFMKVSEDAIDLYGFYDQEELSAFKMLISVSGVGAKSAISILTLMTPQKFAITVSTGDSKALSKAQGIGGKTAARIILELKDKISKEVSANIDDELLTNVPDKSTSGKFNDAIDTLLVLGYNRREAMAALNGIDIPSLDLEAIIKEALKKLMKN